MESKIAARYDVSELERKTTERPLSGQTVTGYGRKMPTSVMVKLPDSPRWRRVYVCCYSNAGTAYVEQRDGRWVVITGGL